MSQTSSPHNSTLQGQRVELIDPRIRLLATLGIATAVTLADDWGELIILAIAVVLFYFWAGVSWQVVYRYIRPFVWLALVAILLAKGEAGATLFQVGLWRYTSGDALAGMWTAMRLLLLITAAIWLTITTSATALAEAMRRLLSPLSRLGVPVESFSMALLVAMRFLPMLADEVQRIRRAQIARGVECVRGLRGVWRRTVSLVIPIFNAGMRRADQLADALVVRGYCREAYALMALGPLGIHDYTLMAIVVILLGFTWLF